MSPIGGVGINLAIQDAVAAANRIAEPLRAHRLTTEDLAAVQARREPPTRKIQRLQLAIQSRVLAPVVAGRGRRVLRFVAFAMRHLAPLRRMAAQTLGVGQLEPVAPLDGRPETQVRSTATQSTNSER
jgi:2-polyprenyl-6-methoxyphenol hydroxylase-like FAD-dependent oxidoreductase